MLDLVKLKSKSGRRVRVKRVTVVKFLTFLATAFLICLVGGVLLAGVMFAWYAKDLPRPDRVRRTSGLSTIIYDREGNPIYDIFRDQNRIPVQLAEIPQMLKDATISVEDKNFYQHEGFSSRGMIRALVNILFFKNLQGGSTLTQQLVKNVLLTSERTIPRKVKEFILAIQIESKYSKDEILQMYLNEAPYGSTTYGIEAAAQFYFGKKAAELSEIESIFLAGLPQSPSIYSPFTGEGDAYIWRSEQIIRRLREDGKISSEQEEQFKKELTAIEFVGGRENFPAAHFVQYIKELLVDQFGQKMVEEGGLRVTTTLDLKLQQEAEQIVEEEVEKIANLKVSNGAAIVIDPQTGEILAMVGSKNYSATDSAGAKFNVVTQGLRQPGSALKPITYAQAFREGYTPSSIIMDVATEFPGGTGQKPYTPKNYDLKWRGPVQIRSALANSINMVAVKTLALVGVKDMLTLAYDMGLTTLEPTTENLARFGLAVTLGGGEVRLIELASAYGVLATGGIRHDSVAILKVTDHNNKKLYEYKPGSGKRVLEEDVAFLVTDILADNTARSLVFGPNSYLNIPGRSVFVKTGTTDDKRDNWTVGGTKSRIVGTWVGNNDNSEMHPSLASGVTGAAPIWNRLIKAAIKNLPDEPFTKPENVVKMEIDAFGGGLPRAEFPTRQEYFIMGTEPTSISPIYQKLKISKANGKLANELEIASGAFEEKEFFIFKEADVVSSDNKNRWQEGIDAWLATQSDPKYHSPTEVSGERSDAVIMNILSPQDQKQYNDHDIKVSGEAFSLGDIKAIIVVIDDKEVDRVGNTDTYSRVFNLDTGPHEIKMTAKDDRGKSATGTVRIGVNVAWDSNIDPTPSPTPYLEPSPTPEASP